MVSTLYGLQTETIVQSNVCETGVKFPLMLELLCWKVLACVRTFNAYFPISGAAPQFMCIVLAGVPSQLICLHGEAH